MQEWEFLMPAIGWHNFHEGTTANFIRSDAPTGPPDFISRSGSVYWNSDGGVFRTADHWGLDIRSCHWFLNGHEVEGAFTGFCRWSDFHHDADRSPAYVRARRLQAEARARARARRARHEALLAAGKRVRLSLQDGPPVVGLIAWRNAFVVGMSDGRRVPLHRIINVSEA